MELIVADTILSDVLASYGFKGNILKTTSFFDIAKTEERYIKVIYAVTLDSGEKLVIKLLCEPNEPRSNRENVEKQSAFSEHLRLCGIDTPRRYSVDGKYCTETVIQGISCTTTVEDWCGEEIKTIDSVISRKIGILMAQMHLISLRDKLMLGCDTLFSAAYDNDVDVFPQFCELTKADGINQNIVAEILALREEKLSKIRRLWERLPKCAVQGDISINNLVLADGELRVFDYNNAGDEVCVGDLIMEGLLTAYEMDLPDGVAQSQRDQLFVDFVKGYLSVRTLTKIEQEVAWDIYTLWHGLWFTRIVYNADSLHELLKCGAVEKANELLKSMLRDMQQEDTGLFAT